MSLMLLKVIHLETPSDPSSAIFWIIGFGMLAIGLVIWKLKKK